MIERQQWVVREHQNEMKSSYVQDMYKNIICDDRYRVCSEYSDVREHAMNSEYILSCTWRTTVARGQNVFSTVIEVLTKWMSVVDKLVMNLNLSVGHELIAEYDLCESSRYFRELQSSIKFKYNIA